INTNNMKEEQSLKDEQKNAIDALNDLLKSTDRRATDKIREINAEILNLQKFYDDKIENLQEKHKMMLLIVDTLFEVASVLQQAAKLYQLTKNTNDVINHAVKKNMGDLLRVTFGYKENLENDAANQNRDLNAEVAKIMDNQNLSTSQKIEELSKIFNIEGNAGKQILENAMESGDFRNFVGYAGAKNFTNLLKESLPKDEKERTEEEQETAQALEAVEKQFSTSSNDMTITDNKALVDNITRLLAYNARLNGFNGSNFDDKQVQQLKSLSGYSGTDFMAKLGIEIFGGNLFSSLTIPLPEDLMKVDTFFGNMGNIIGDKGLQKIKEYSDARDFVNQYKTDGKLDKEKIAADTTTWNDGVMSGFKGDIDLTDWDVVQNAFDLLSFLDSSMNGLVKDTQVKLDSGIVVTGKDLAVNIITFIKQDLSSAFDINLRQTAQSLFDDLTNNKFDDYLSGDSKSKLLEILSQLSDKTEDKAKSPTSVESQKNRGLVVAEARQKAKEKTSDQIAMLRAITQKVQEIRAETTRYKVMAQALMALSKLNVKDIKDNIQTLANNSFNTTLVDVAGKMDKALNSALNTLAYAITQLSKMDDKDLLTKRGQLTLRMAEDALTVINNISEYASKFQQIMKLDESKFKDITGQIGERWGEAGEKLERLMTDVMELANGKKITSFEAMNLALENYGKKIEEITVLLNDMQDPSLTDSQLESKLDKLEVLEFQSRQHADSALLIGRSVIILGEQLSKETQIRKLQDVIRTVTSVDFNNDGISQSVKDSIEVLEFLKVVVEGDVSVVELTKSLEKIMIMEGMGEPADTASPDYASSVDEYYSLLESANKVGEVALGTIELSEKMTKTMNAVVDISKKDGGVLTLENMQRLAQSLVDTQMNGENILDTLNNSIDMKMRLLVKEGKDLKQKYSGDNNSIVQIKTLESEIEKIFFEDFKTQNPQMSETEAKNSFEKKYYRFDESGNKIGMKDYFKKADLKGTEATFSKAMVTEKQEKIHVLSKDINSSYKNVDKMAKDLSVLSNSIKELVKNVEAGKDFKFLSTVFKDGRITVEVERYKLPKEGIDGKLETEKITVEVAQAKTYLLKKLLTSLSGSNDCIEKMMSDDFNKMQQREKSTLYEKMLANDSRANGLFSIITADNSLQTLEQNILNMKENGILKPEMEKALNNAIEFYKVAAQDVTRDMIKVEDDMAELGKLEDL
ncbi:MAG: hypothetical protein ACD_79C01254G0001, partial [uncultured bacterium]